MMLKPADKEYFDQLFKDLREWEELKFKVLEDKLDATKKRVEDSNQTLGSIFEDRGIFEKIDGDLKGLSEQLMLKRQSENTVKRDLETKIENTGLRTEVKIDDLKDTLKDKGVIIKKGFVENLRHRFKKR